MSDKNYFEELYKIDVSEHTEKKNGLTYLSWAWAWAELKKRFPDALYKVYESADGWNYFHDGQTAWVKTGVTVCGIEHVEYLPVMDNRNRSIPLGSITSFDVNKSIQRSLTKAVARHGLGLYIYAGEDLPDASDEPQDVKPKKAPKKETAKAPAKAADGQTHRDLFREFIAEKKPSSAVVSEIINKIGLSNESPDEAWFEALCLAKKMLG